MLLDPFGIDRRLRDVAKALARFRAEVREGRGTDHVFEDIGRYASSSLVGQQANDIRCCKIRVYIAPTAWCWRARTLPLKGPERATERCIETASSKRVPYAGTGGGDHG